MPTIEQQRQASGNHIKTAFHAFADARRHMTIWEFQDFISKNLTELGGRGFIASIGEAIVAAARDNEQFVSEKQK